MSVISKRYCNFSLIVEIDRYWIATFYIHACAYVKCFQRRIVLWCGLPTDSLISDTFNMARKTREEAEQTRHLLLDTAEQLFSEKGVSKTTLADIASAAGLTRGAVYWHFQNKLDLYRAMLDRMSGQFDDICEHLLRTAHSSPALALWNHSHRLLTMIGDNPQVRRILLILFMRSEHVGELAPIHDECVAHMQETREQLTLVVQMAVDAGQTLPYVNPETVAEVLQSMHHGLINRWLADGSQTNLGENATQLLQYVYRGIFLPEVMEELSPQT